MKIHNKASFLLNTYIWFGKANEILDVSKTYASIKSKKNQYAVVKDRQLMCLENAICRC